MACGGIKNNSRQEKKEVMARHPQWDFPVPGPRLASWDAKVSENQSLDSQELVTWPGGQKDIYSHSCLNIIIERHPLYSGSTEKRAACREWCT